MTFLKSKEQCVTTSLAERHCMLVDDAGPGRVRGEADGLVFPSVLALTSPLSFLPNPPLIASRSRHEQQQDAQRRQQQQKCFPSSHPRHISPPSQTAHPLHPHPRSAHPSHLLIFIAPLFVLTRPHLPPIPLLSPLRRRIHLQSRPPRPTRLRTLWPQVGRVGRETGDVACC